MGKKSFLIDVDKCTSCQLCIIACKDEHVGSQYSPWTMPQPDTGQFWIKVQSLERGQIPRVRMSYLPTLCQHCENAPCIKSCPENAIKRRDDGLVWIDSAACTGCGLCQEACPYDVIYMNKELEIAQKCTGCAHRVDAGSLPRCAEVCPHDAIVFGDESDDMFRHVEGDHGLEFYHPEYQAQPLVYWKNLPKPWIAGIIIDADSDEIISGAVVSAIDLIMDKTHVVSSDEFGDFWIKGLEAERKYKVTVKAEGYEEILQIVTMRDDHDMGTVSLTKLPTAASRR